MDTRANASSERPPIHDGPGKHAIVPNGHQIEIHAPHVGHMHVHGTECGHEALLHEGHLDYVHGEHRHHLHEHHYDEH